MDPWNRPGVLVVKRCLCRGAVCERQQESPAKWHGRYALRGVSRKVLELESPIRSAAKYCAADGECIAQLDVAPEVRDREHLERLMSSALDVAISERRQVEVDLVLQVTPVRRERHLQGRPPHREALKDPGFDLVRALRLKRGI